MSDKTLRWKLFPFSLMGKAKHWYNLTLGSRQGDWEALCSSFCLQFFPISRLVRLCLEVLSFRQKKKESLGMAWEHFDTLIKTGPNLTIQDPILLQHFYMGLNRKTSRRRNMASRGSFLLVSANTGRSILTKILEDAPEEVEEKPLEEESQIAESESIENPSLTLAILDPEPPKKVETPILDFMLKFKDELFDEYGNTSNYHTMRNPRSIGNHHPMKNL